MKPHLKPCICSTCLQARVDVFNKGREDALREVEEKNKDYLKKLCWTDEDIIYFLRQYNSLKPIKPLNNW